MANDIPFVKDLWWKNPSTIVDDASNASDYDNNICKKLNQSSGYIEFQTSSPDLDFYCATYNQPVYPDQIYTSVRIIDGSYSDDFDLSLSINDVVVFDETFNHPFITPIGASGVILSGYFSPTDNQLKDILKIRQQHITSGFFHDVIKISVSSGIGQQIEQIELQYFGGSTENSYNSLTPNILSYNPNGIAGNSLYDNTGSITTDSSLVSGEITNSATESTYIYISGFNYNTNYNENYIDFKFDLDDYFGKNSNNITNQVDKIIFGLRYSLASGAQTNNQEFSSVFLFSNKSNQAIGWGSGFYFKDTGGSFVSNETLINFVRDYKPDNYFNSSDLLDKFTVRLGAVPADCKISACELDIYIHDDSVFAMHIPGAVYASSGVKPLNDTRLFNPGRNRFVEDFSYTRLMPTRDLMEDPGPSTFGIKYQHPIWWGNYYEDTLDTYQYHNHEYLNFALLSKSGYYYNNMNSTNSYSFLLHISTSGNYNYMYGRNGANILNKQAPDGTEFLLNIAGDKYEFVSYDEFGTPAAASFDSTAHDIIVITKQEGATDTLKIYKSNTYGFFNEVFTDSRSLRGGFGKIYIGGSGVDDFEGYLHEYGYNENQAIDIDRFNRARFSLSEALAVSGISWDVQPTSGNLEDQFSLRYELDGLSDPFLYQYCTPAIFAYQNWVTNPSSFNMLLDYKFESSNPSGLHISGNYVQKFVKNGEYQTMLYRFDHVLPSSGDETIRIYPFEVSNVYDEIPTRELNNSPSLTIYIKSYDNDGSRNKLTINSLEMEYDGWYLPQTGIGINDSNIVNMIINGYTVDNDSFDFFLANSVVNSGVDLFIKGNEASNKFLNFYVAADLILNSGMSMITTGQQVKDKSLSFIIAQGFQPSNGGINLFTEGTTPIVDTASVQLFTTATAQSGVYNSQPLVVFSNFDYRNSIDFFIGLSEIETEDSINFFVEGNKAGKNKFNMYIPNQQEHVDYEFDMTLPSAYNQSGNLNMFIEGS